MAQVKELNWLAFSELIMAYVSFEPEALERMTELMMDFVGRHCTLSEEGHVPHRILMGTFRSFLRVTKVDLDVKPGVFKATMLEVMERVPAITRTEDPVTYHGLVISDPTYAKPKGDRSTADKKPTVVVDKADPAHRRYERIHRFFSKHCSPDAESTVPNADLFERFNADAAAYHQPRMIPSELKAAMAELMELYPISRQEQPARYTGFRLN